MFPTTGFKFQHHTCVSAYWTEIGFHALCGATGSCSYMHVLHKDLIEHREALPLQLENVTAALSAQLCRAQTPKSSNNNQAHFWVEVDLKQW